MLDVIHRIYRASNPGNPRDKQLTTVIIGLPHDDKIFVISIRGIKQFEHFSESLVTIVKASLDPCGNGIGYTDSVLFPTLHRSLPFCWNFCGGFVSVLAQTGHMTGFVLVT